MKNKEFLVLILLNHFPYNCIFSIYFLAKGDGKEFLQTTPKSYCVCLSMSGSGVSDEDVME